MNIHLDLTTSQTVYNPLSAKAQWIHHRFGQRNIDLELPLESVLNVINDPMVSHITLDSCFGDVCEYTHFAQTLEHIHSQNKTCTVITYGMNKTALDAVKKYNFTIFVKVCDRVFLGSCFEQIIANIGDYDNCIVEETVFKHNQQSRVKSMCCERNWQYYTTHGFAVSGFCTSIIDSTGKWLYDVYPVDSNGPSTLYKNTTAWHRLKMFVKPEEGTSILDNVELPSGSNDISDLLKDNSEVFVSVSGHVLVNRQIATVFSNALCDDWNARKLDRNNDYERNVIRILRAVKKIGLENISINNVNIADAVKCFV